MTTEESTGEWMICKTDTDYEIWSEYPYPIRRKRSDEPISEFIMNNGYVGCCLNENHYLKHRIIAQQFIPNPDNLPCIDHINRIKTDNRIENLKWCSYSENNKNKSSNHDRQYVFLDELPETAEPLELYNNHEFDDLWIDYGTQKLYLFNGIKYRELLEYHNKYSIFYYVYDRNSGKYTRLYHGKLFD